MSICRRRCNRLLGFLFLLTTAAPRQAMAQAPAGDVREQASETQTRALLAAKLAQTYAVKDFNADRVPDIAFVDFLTDRVTVLSGDATGHFGQTLHLTVPGGPRAIIAEDFNGDTLPDLAVASFFSGRIAIFLGLGEGRFSEPEVIELEPGLTSLVSKDFNDDGQPDIATANFLSGDLTILKGAGGGAFVAEAAIPGHRGTTALLTGDLTADGSDDLVAVDAAGTSARLFAGGAGTLFRDAGAVELPAATTARLSRSRHRVVEAEASRIVPFAGDGQAASIGSTLAEPLVAMVHTRSGQDSRISVTFSALAGAGVWVGGPTANADEQGRVSLNVRLPQVPENELVAFADGEAVAVFGALSVLTAERFFTNLRTILEPSASALRQLINETEQRVKHGQIVDAVAILSGTVAAVSADTSPQAAAYRDTTKRVINQLLLVGAATATGVLPCDQPVTGTILSATQVDQWSFDVVIDQERVHITVGAIPFLPPPGLLNGPVWRVIDRAGNGVGACATFAGGGRDCGPLALTGSPYVVEVRDNDFGATGSLGTYTLHLQRLTAGARCGGTISCNVPVDPASARIEAPADTDLFEFGFAGLDQEKVHITVGGPSNAPVWRLVDRAGTPVVGCATFTGGERDCGPLAVAGGPYAVEVQDNDFGNTGALGTYSLHLQRLTAGVRCGGTLPCNVPISDPATATIEAAADTDLFEFAFASVDQEKVHITVGAVPFLPPPGLLNGPVWRLIDRAGNGVGACGTFAGGERDCGPLPVAGRPYAVEVRDNDFGVTGSLGTYTLHLQRLTAGVRCGGTLPCNVPISDPATATIEAAADTDLFEFAFASVDEEKVHITVGAVPFLPPPGLLNGAVWRLIDRVGNGVGACGTFAGGERDCGPLALAGSPYALEVRDNDFGATGSLGTYNLHLQRLTAGARCSTNVPCGVPVTDTIVRTSDTSLFNFGVTVPSGIVHVATGPGPTPPALSSPLWRLLDRSGSPVPNCVFDPMHLTGDCDVSFLGSPYAVEVRDNDFGSTGSLGNYTITVTGSCVPPPPPPPAGTLFVSSTEADSLTKIDLATRAATTCQVQLPSAEGIACGLDGRVYVALSGAFDVDRKIVSVNRDCSDPKTVLDFATTPSLAESGGPEGPSFGPTGELFFNTRSALGFPHTGIWKLSASGTPVQVVLPFTGDNGEATAFLTRGPFAGHLVAADFPNGRVIRRAPPFDSAQVAVDFITGLAAPNGVAVNSVGEVFIGHATGAITKCAADGSSCTEFAATGLSIRKITVDAADNVYAATADGPIVRVLPDGTLAGTGISIPGGNGIAQCSATTGQPDLITSSITDPPPTSTLNSTFGVTDTVKNQGTQFAGASTSRYYLSLDGTKSAADIRLTVLDAGGLAIAGRAVPPLAPGQTSTGIVTVRVPTSTTVKVPGPYFLIACADDLLVVAETNETNNCVASATTVTLTAPDLSELTVSPPPAVAVLGSRFAVTDIVKNLGTAPAPPSTTRYYFSLDKLKNTGDKLTGTRGVLTLAPGQESMGTATITVPASTRLPGPYFLLACADDTAKVVERNAAGDAERNNCVASTTTVTITAPDLVESSLTEPPLIALLNGKFPVSDCTLNVPTATADAARSTTRFYLSPDGVLKTKLLTGTRTVPGLLAVTLPPGQASCGTTTVTVPSTTALGFYLLLACADDLKRVDEGSLLNDGSAEQNNCRRSGGKIQIKAPDLIEAVVSNPPAASRLGGLFAVTDTAVNQVSANGAAGPSTTRYYLSPDQIRNAGDVRLTGSRSVPALAVGVSSTGTVNVTVPLTGVAPGSYFLLACADDLNQVAEGSTAFNAEANNCTSSATKVVVSP